MAHSLTWLPDVLKDAGLKVSLVPGWENRGRGDVGKIFGVLCHHTVGPRNGNMPSLNTLINGRGGQQTAPWAARSTWPRSRWNLFCDRRGKGHPRRPR